MAAIFILALSESAVLAGEWNPPLLATETPLETITPGPSSTPDATPTPSMLTPTPVISVTPEISPFATVTLVPTNFITPTALPEPGIPELVYPDDDARFGASSVPFAFEWSEVEFADSYEIEIAIDEDFTASTGSIATTGTIYDLAEIITGEDWVELVFSAFWRVRAVNSAGAPGEWSIVYEFSKTMMNAPQIITPENDARYGIGDTPPYFEWSRIVRANLYVFSLYGDPECENYLGELALTATTLFLSDYIDQGDWNPVIGTFYYRIEPVNEYGNPGPKSEVRYFSKTTISSPEIKTPADDHHYASTSVPPYLEWSAVGQFPDYMLGFSPDPDFTEDVSVLEWTGTSIDFSEYVSEAEWNDVYFTIYWRASAIDQYGNHGIWSDAHSFTKNGKLRFMAYGDSITGGYGAADFPDTGYFTYLEAMLKNICPEAEVESYWFGGGKSGYGDLKLPEAMREVCPDYVMTLFGTVDLVDPNGCDPPFDCRTVEHLENICLQVRERKAVPIIGKLPPPNPAGTASSMDGIVQYRNWEIEEMAYINGFLVAEIYDDFQAASWDLSSLFFDYVHPNDFGYQVMAESWFNAIMGY